MPGRPRPPPLGVRVKRRSGIGRGCAELGVRRRADAAEDDRLGAVVFAEQAQRRFLDAFADRLEANLERAGRGRRQLDAGAALVEDLEAADRAPGDHGDEHAAGHVAGVGDRDLAGRAGRAHFGDAEIGRFGGRREGRPPSGAAEPGGERVRADADPELGREFHRVVWAEVDLRVAGLFGLQGRAVAVAAAGPERSRAGADDFRRADLEFLAAGVAKREARAALAPQLSGCTPKSCAAGSKTSCGGAGGSSEPSGGAARPCGGRRQQGDSGGEQGGGKEGGRDLVRISESGHGRLIDSICRSEEGRMRKFTCPSRYEAHLAEAVSLRGPRLKPAPSSASSWPEPITGSPSSFSTAELRQAAGGDRVGEGAHRRLELGAVELGAGGRMPRPPRST